MAKSPLPRWCESGVIAPADRHDPACFLGPPTRAIKVAKVDVEGSNPFSRSTFSADLSIEHGQPRSRTVTWYREGLDHDGTTYVLTFDVSDEAFVRTFETAAAPIEPSIASQCKLDVIDCIAWRVGRTLPPMSVLVEMAGKLGEQSASGG
jgi:hypothetical protein